MSTDKQSKTSLVEFLRSIKFRHRNGRRGEQVCATHFAEFEQRARTRRQYSSEDKQLVRSAN